MRSVRRRRADGRTTRTHPRTGTPSSAIATESFTVARSGGSSTRPKSSSTTKATCSARGSRTRSRSRRFRAPSPARSGLNEDLVEAIALAHDLGHTPFGHAGQDALNACMRDFGGFEHNLQSLRVVDLLEERYASFPGLNLTYETREGILKHCSRKNARELGALGERFLNGGQPSLEAQVANLADEIAYNNHDVDDGLRAGLLDIETLTSAAFFREQYETVHARWPDLTGRRVVHETIRAMINHQATDLLETSRAAIGAAGPGSVDEVRGHRTALIGFSESMLEQHQELKQLLRKELYRHYRVYRMSMKAQRIVKDLFDAFFNTPRSLPHDTQRRIEERGGNESERARLVADYVAGMTDRFAIAEYGRLFDVDALT